MSAESATEKNTATNIVCLHDDDVKQVKALPDYTLDVVFMDETRGKVFMKKLIFSDHAGVFALLKDVTVFNQVFVEYGATTWPGEIDLAPDAMYVAFKKHKQWAPM